MFWFIIIIVQVLIAIGLIFKAKTRVDLKDIEDIQNFNIFMFITGLTSLIPILGLVWDTLILLNKNFK